MERLFLNILNLSLTGGYAVLCVLAVRFLLTRLPRVPRAVPYALWLAPFLRLALPFSIKLPHSPVPIRANAIPTIPAALSAPAADAGLPAMNQTVRATPSVPDLHAATVTPSPVSSAAAAPAASPLSALLFWGAAVWLCVLAVLLAHSLLRTLRLRRELSGAVRADDGAYECTGLETPFVFGLFRPRVYLPAGLSGEERAYILAHERHHIARRDPIWRMLAFLAVCVHWFNPLVWAAFWLMGVDMERSCDEAVLRRFGGDIRRAYSTSLLNLSTAGYLLRGSPIGFSEGGLRGRIRSILNYRRPALWVTVLAALCAAVVGCGLMTAPMEEPEISAAASVLSAAQDAAPASSSELQTEVFSAPHLCYFAYSAEDDAVKLLLSQPARQGAGGIWCVEQTRSAAGPVQHTASESDREQYQRLQDEADAGLRPELTDPEQVARAFLPNVSLQEHYDNAVLSGDPLLEFFSVFTVSHQGLFTRYDDEGGYLEMRAGAMDEETGEIVLDRSFEDMPQLRRCFNVAPDAIWQRLSADGVFEPVDPAALSIDGTVFCQLCERNGVITQIDCYDVSDRVAPIQTGDIISWVYHPIYQAEHAFRVDPESGRVQVSADGGASWRFYRADDEAGQALASDDGVHWEPLFDPA